MAHASTIPSINTPPVHITVPLPPPNNNNNDVTPTVSTPANSNAVKSVDTAGSAPVLGSQSAMASPSAGATFTMRTPPVSDIPPTSSTMPSTMLQQHQNLSPLTQPETTRIAPETETGTKNLNAISNKRKRSYLKTATENKINTSLATTSTTSIDIIRKPVKRVCFRETDKYLMSLSAYNFAECYRLGKQIPQNHKKALYYHLKASGLENSYLPSTHILAKMFLRGKGLKDGVKDFPRAVTFFSRAAHERYPPSQTALAECYLNCIGGLDLNTELAFDLLRAAKNGGDTRAIIIYADCIKNGYVDTKAGDCKIERIIEDYKLGVCKGSNLAKVRLGLCFCTGYGVIKDEVKGVQLLRDGTDGGEYEGYVPLAKCYIRGFDGQFPDKRAAVNLLRKGCEKIDQVDGEGFEKEEGLVMEMLADCLWDNICEDEPENEKKRKEEAFQWWEKSAEKGVCKSMLKLAQCYQTGKYVQKSHAECRRWLRRAVEEGDNNHEGVGEAHISLAQCLIDKIGGNRDVEKGIQLLKQCIKSSDKTHLNVKVRALVELGRRYVAGIGIGIDVKQGVRCLNDACYHCHSHERLAQVKNESLFLLAHVYLRGGNNISGCDTDVNVDFEKAVALLKQAADFGLGQKNEGHGPATALLGKCFMYGVGVEKDTIKAAEFFAKAAKYGDRDGQRDLALCFLHGIGLKKDSARCILLLTQLCSPSSDNNGETYEENVCDGVAARYLAELKLSGRECERDLPGAISLLKKGTRCGDSGCMRILGICYRDGIGVEMDVKNAFKYLKDAVCNHDKLAYELLAQCYETGTGTTGGQIDWIQAVNMYESAVKTRIRHDECLEKLLNCYTKGSCIDEKIAENEIMVLTKIIKDDVIKSGLLERVECRFAWMLFKCIGVRRSEKSRAVGILEGVLKKIDGGAVYDKDRRGVLDLTLRLLGECLCSGSMGIDGKERGLKYLKRASDEGFPMGKVMFAKFVIQEIGLVEEVERNNENMRKGIELLNEAADMNNGMACELLGDFYSKGHIQFSDDKHKYRYVQSSNNWETAVKYYKKAATNKISSSGYADYRLGRCYLTGRGNLEINECKGLQLLKQAMRNGCLPAQVSMARFLEHGLHGVTRDISGSLKLYEGCVHLVSGKRGARAMWRYANVLRNEGTRLGKFISQEAADKRVCGLMERSKQGGCAAAGNDLAVSVLKEYFSAREQREKEGEIETEKRRNDAKRENEETKGDDNNDEEDDRGTEEESCGKAFRIFLEMGQAGERRALTNAGICLDQGLGIMKDIQAAKAHYEKAASMGDSIAMNNLAVILLQENKSVRNEEETREKHQRGRKLLNEAYEVHGDIRGLVNLAKLNEEEDVGGEEETNGNGNDNGSASASGSGSENGKNMERVRERRRNNQGNQLAFQMYCKAAEEGCREGVFNVAACYESEIGTERNERLSVKYYRKALHAGCELAEQRLNMYADSEFI